MNMDARHITAFLEATQAVFSTMMKIPVTFASPKLNTATSQHDVSGLIGLSGDVVGCVVVGFNKESAVKITSALAGSPMEFGTADFADAVGELANMIAGGAKAKFKGMEISIGCPSVVIATAHSVHKPSSAASLSIPCSTPAGTFTIDVTFQANAKRNSLSSVDSAAA